MTRSGANNYQKISLKYVDKKEQNQHSAEITGIAKTMGYISVYAVKVNLFDSSAKFDSGTGWPSFYQALDSEKVATKEDSSLFMTRTEVLCNKCDSHLGHVFSDGPQPTGMRFCINSTSLQLKKK